MVQGYHGFQRVKTRAPEVVPLRGSVVWPFYYLKPFKRDPTVQPEGSKLQPPGTKDLNTKP